MNRSRLSVNDFTCQCIHAIKFQIGTIYFLQIVQDRLVSYSGEGCFNQETYSMMRQAAVVLLKKEITVNVFALCNTGKSTLLNAILGDRYSGIVFQLKNKVQSISAPISCNVITGTHDYYVL